MKQKRPSISRLGVASVCSMSGMPGTILASLSAIAVGPELPHTKIMPCSTCTQDQLMRRHIPCCRRHQFLGTSSVFAGVEHSRMPRRSGPCAVGMYTAVHGASHAAAGIGEIQSAEHIQLAFRGLPTTQERGLAQAAALAFASIDWGTSVHFPSPVKRQPWYEHISVPSLGSMRPSAC